MSANKNISAASVKELRQLSGAGMMDCKKALDQSGGNVDAALKILREQGIKVAGKKASREASDGLIHSYIHGGGRIGVLVEVNCETDFVARTEDFKLFCKQIAMQIAASDPGVIKRDDLDQEVVENEKEILKNQLKDSGKPEHIIEKIITGRLEKFFSENCLIDQEWVHDSSAGTVGDVLTSLIARVGENIVMRRFVRFEIGVK